MVILVIILVALVLLPYCVCDISSHTAVFIGKRKIT